MLLKLPGEGRHGSPLLEPRPQQCPCGMVPFYPLASTVCPARLTTLITLINHQTCQAAEPGPSSRLVLRQLCRQPRGREAGRLLTPLWQPVENRSSLLSVPARIPNPTASSHPHPTAPSRPHPAHIHALHPACVHIRACLLASMSPILLPTHAHIPHPAHIHVPHPLVLATASRIPLPAPIHIPHLPARSQPHPASRRRRAGRGEDNPAHARGHTQLRVPEGHHLPPASQPLSPPPDMPEPQGRASVPRATRRGRASPLLGTGSPRFTPSPLWFGFLPPQARYRPSPPLPPGSCLPSPCPHVTAGTGSTLSTRDPRVPEHRGTPETFDGLQTRLPPGYIRGQR